MFPLRVNIYYITLLSIWVCQADVNHASIVPNTVKSPVQLEHPHTRALLPPPDAAVAVAGCVADSVVDVDGPEYVLEGCTLIMNRPFLPPMAAALVITFPGGRYSHTTYQPCAYRYRPEASFPSSSLLYPQSTAAHPTCLVAFQTSCVKCPVSSVNPVGWWKS